MQFILAAKSSKYVPPFRARAAMGLSAGDRSPRTQPSEVSSQPQQATTDVDGDAKWTTVRGRNVDGANLFSIVFEKNQLFLGKNCSSFKCQLNC